MHILKVINESFEKHFNVYWGNLSRLTNLLVILNISLFFLTELVTRQGYYYTFFSLLCLGIVAFGLLAPLGLVNRLWYYCIFLFAELAAIYFLTASIWFWVVTNKI